MQKKWFRGMYHIASLFIRNPGKVAKVLANILIDEKVENGMICDLRKRFRPIPVIDEQEKEDFRKTCYDMIDPFLK